MKDIKSKIFFVNFRKAFKSYDTCYLRPLNADKPLLDHGNYKSIDLEDNDINVLSEKLF